MDIKDIILFILIILVIFLVTGSCKTRACKTNNKENEIIVDKFAQDTDTPQSSISLPEITSAINYYYNEDVMTLKYINSITKTILNSNNSISPIQPTLSPVSTLNEKLVIPANTTINQNLNIYNNMNISGNLKVTGNVYFKNNKNLAFYDILPPGVILAWNSNNIPPGWRVCDGTYNSPDLRYRFILTPNQSFNLKSTLGEDSHILTDAETIHTHSHTPFAINTDSNRYAGVTADASYQPYNMKPIVQIPANVGNNTPHTNLPPYMVLIYIIKYNNKI